MWKELLALTSTDLNFRLLTKDWSTSMHSVLYAPKAVAMMFTASTIALPKYLRKFTSSGAASTNTSVGGFLTI